MADYQLVAIIPHYNHSGTIGAVVEQLLAVNLPVLIVDDGSLPEHISILQNLAKQPNVSLVCCAQNGGKGAAVKIGLKQAVAQGFTHAVQVDADGQHNLTDVLEMQKKSQQKPTALVCGRPIYGEDAPKSRLYGRKITNFWNAIHTWSFDLKDGMCGFRLYPLASIIPLIEQEYIGERMDFDIEILVKAHWRQIPFIWVDTPVKYERNGISHFRAWADNVMISKMHSRLFFGMLKRVFTGQKL